MRAELPDQAAVTLAKLRQDYRQPSFFAVVYIPDKGRTTGTSPPRSGGWRSTWGMGESARTA